MAEVSVKITASNETQTGFQSVLADAQKTASQVQQTMQRATQTQPNTAAWRQMESPKPFTVDIGDYGLEPLREMQRELQQVRESAREALSGEPAQGLSSGVAGVAGRLALLAGVAGVVGKAIASAFDKLSQAVRSAISIQEQFNATLKQAGQATSLSGVVAEFKSLQKAADDTGKVIKESLGRNIGEAFANALSGRPGQLMARLADFATGGMVSRELSETEEQQRRIARDTTRGNLARLESQELDRLEAGGDPRKLAEIERRQQRQQEEEQLRASLQGQPRQFVQEQVAQLRRIQDLQDRNTGQRDQFDQAEQARKEREREQERQRREAEREASKLSPGTRLGNVVGEQLGPGNFQGIAAFERAQAQRAGEIARGLLAENNPQRGANGSLTASSLQRIGFASNEFRDTRTKDDPTKSIPRIADLVKEIVAQLKKAEPLVLPSSN